MSGLFCNRAWGPPPRAFFFIVFLLCNPKPHNHTTTQPTYLFLHQPLLYMAAVSWMLTVLTIYIKPTFPCLFLFRYIESGIYLYPPLYFPNCRLEGLPDSSYGGSPARPRVQGWGRGEGLTWNCQSTSDRPTSRVAELLPPSGLYWKQIRLVLPPPQQQLPQTWRQSGQSEWAITTLLWSSSSR